MLTYVLWTKGCGDVAIFCICENIFSIMPAYTKFHEYLMIELKYVDINCICMFVWFSMHATQIVKYLNKGNSKSLVVL